MVLSQDEQLRIIHSIPESKLNELASHLAMTKGSGKILGAAMSFSKCRGWLDYGKKKKCPEYDLSQCATPHLPPSCPMKHNFFKRPCYRYRCSAEEETDVLELLVSFVLSFLKF